MSEPRPDKWADLLRPTYKYPEDDTDRSRRARRRARRQWRAQDHQARRDWVAERRESVSGRSSREGNSGCAGVVIVLALVMIVLGVTRGCSEPEQTPQPTAIATAVEGPSPTPTSATTSTPAPEVETEAPPAEAIAAPEDVMQEWARAWFTFTPTTGDHESSRMDRAEPLMTPELARYLWREDPLATYYTDNGIDLTVQDVEISVPPEGAAPVDHETRVTRLATITTLYTAGPETGQTFTTTYAVVVYRTAADQPWQVGDYTSTDGH